MGLSFHTPDASDLVGYAGGPITGGQTTEVINLGVQDIDSGLTGTFAAATSATPLPAALPLFATGLGALGLFGWRRKRKNANRTLIRGGGSR